MADVGQKERIMKILNVSAKEADEILAYDKLVEQGKPTPYDLSKDEEKKLRKYRQADRKPVNYKFTQRERKPNATKEGIVVEIAEFLKTNSAFAIENVEITNKNREITFEIANEVFTWTLVQKRRPKI